MDNEKQAANQTSETSQTPIRGRHFLPTNFYSKNNNYNNKKNHHEYHNIYNDFNNTVYHNHNTKTSDNHSCEIFSSKKSCQC